MGVTDDDLAEEKVESILGQSGVHEGLAEIQDKRRSIVVVFVGDNLVELESLNRR